MSDRKFTPTIGLEIHCELKTKSKMFCSCANNPAQDTPNKDICPICAGHPGALPTINQKAVESVIKAGVALNCEIAKVSKFDRKNYFYPDLPKGYQISQYDQPICENGFLIVNGKRVRIKRIHLEEDAGKNIHKNDCALIDFNRAGVPLMELVTEPDIASGEEARKFAQELQLIFRYLDISDADMEKGQMRVEVNISVSNTGIFGTKVEIKNINSFSAVEKAVDFEIARQTEMISSGAKVEQETRGWDGGKGITVSQRSKEGSSDYRYFPEPDLPPLDLAKMDIARIIGKMPELPNPKRVRFKEEYGLTDKEIEVFVEDRQMGEYYEKVASELLAWVKAQGENEGYAKIVKLAANYILTDFRGLMEGKQTKDTQYPITPENFAELVSLVFMEKISSKIAKLVLLEMFATGADPSQIIREKGMAQMSDEGELEKTAKKIVENNPQAIKDYKAGKTNVVMFLVGQMMKETQGRAKPDLAQKLIEQTLNKA